MKLLKIVGLIVLTVLFINGIWAEGVRAWGPPDHTSIAIRGYVRESCETAEPEFNEYLVGDDIFLEIKFNENCSGAWVKRVIEYNVEESLIPEHDYIINIVSLNLFQVGYATPSE